MWSTSALNNAPRVEKFHGAIGIARKTNPIGADARIAYTAARRQGGRSAYNRGWRWRDEGATQYRQVDQLTIPMEPVEMRRLSANNTTTEEAMYAQPQQLRFRLSLVPALLIVLFLLGTLAARAATVNVKIQGFAFDPTPLTVNVGDTVTWTNNDTAPHNATADDGTFKTPDLQQGQSASVTMTKPGTFAYICTIHPRMKGTVIVQAAGTPNLPSTGGGGMAAQADLPWLVAGLAALVALLGGGIILRRRRAN